MHEEMDMKQVEIDELQSQEFPQQMISLKSSKNAVAESGVSTLKTSSGSVRGIEHIKEITENYLKSPIT
jgi:hypothetical protein